MFQSLLLSCFLVGAILICLGFLIFSNSKSNFFFTSKPKSPNLSTEKLLQKLEYIYKNLIFCLSEKKNINLMTNISNIKLDQSDQFFCIISKKIQNKNDKTVDVEFISRSIKNGIFIDTLRFDISKENEIKLIEVLNRKDQHDK